MKKLPQIVMFPELMGAILEQFSFMKAMGEPQDNNIGNLMILDLNYVFKKADEYFVQLTDENGVIMSDEQNLEKELREFLKEFSQITDITAIQQNIHNRMIEFSK